MAEIKKLFILIFSLFLYAHDSPYILNKFKSVLEIAKLQAPESKFNSLYCRKYGDFEEYSNEYFYLQDMDYMVFYMCGNHNRSELRFKNDWKTDTTQIKYIEARVKIFPLNIKREFTFLQIHADDTLKDSDIINKPLLRIVWYKTLKGLKNHIWAVVRLSGNVSVNEYRKIDLGIKPKGFFNVKITILKDRLNIYINEEKKVNMLVSYWNKYFNYFKAGVYLQSNGCAKVLFKNLKVKD